jgi:hypothetical protein
MPDDKRREDLDAARKEGRDDATLLSHTAHLAEINGSIRDSATALDKLVREVHANNAEQIRALERTERELRDALRDLSENLTTELRKMQDEARLRDAAVKVAADTLEADAKARRDTIALDLDARDRAAEASDRDTRSHDAIFTRRQGIIVAVAGIGLALLGLILGHPWR